MRTVAKYLLRTRKPPSQRWATFLSNHLLDLAAIAFFTVRAATFRVPVLEWWSVCWGFHGPMSRYSRFRVSPFAPDGLDYRRFTYSNQACSHNLALSTTPSWVYI